LKNKEFEKVISSYNLDINKFYQVEGKLHPYCYVGGTVYIEIYEISKQSFEAFQIKKRIEQTTQAHKKCFEENDYSYLFILIDKPLRFEWYKKLFDKIPDDQKYEVFIDIYSSSEYGFRNLDRTLVEEIFKDHTTDKELFDTDVIPIYRGEDSKSTPYKKAYSWTTNLETAKWFANRFSKNGKIYKGQVNVKDILDYLEGRSESEVLVFPENVFNVERM